MAKITRYRDLYNAIKEYYSKLGEIIVLTVDISSLHVEFYNDDTEHRCTISYYCVIRGSNDKRNKFIYADGCIYRYIDGQTKLGLHYLEHARKKFRTFYETINLLFDNISNYHLANKSFQYIHPDYARTIISKLIKRDSSYYDNVFDNKLIPIKVNKCQICDSSNVTEEKNHNDEIVYYCDECNPYVIPSYSYT